MSRPLNWNEDEPIEATAHISADLAKALMQSDELLERFRRELADEIFRLINEEMEAS